MIGVTADCTQPAEVDRAFAEAAVAFGAVDIAVACVGGGGMIGGKVVKTAGVEPVTRHVAEHSLDDYMSILATTQFATFYTCRSAAASKSTEFVKDVTVVSALFF